MKRIIALVLLIAIAFSSIPVIANENPVSMSIDGETVVFPDLQPFIDENNRTLIPFSRYAMSPSRTSSFFNNTYWYEDTQTLYILHERSNKTGDYLRITIGKNEIEKGKYSERTITHFFPETTFEMDTVAVFKDGATFVPIRYVADLLNYTVEWDAAANSINLRRNETEYNIMDGVFAEKIFTSDEWLMNFSQFHPQYDDSFFEDNFLVVIYSTNGTNQKWFEVVSATEKGDLIEIVLSPPIRSEEDNRGGPEVVTSFLDFVELDKSLSDKDISLVFVPR